MALRHRVEFLTRDVEELKAPAGWPDVYPCDPILLLGRAHGLDDHMRVNPLHVGASIRPAFWYLWSTFVLS